VRPPAIPWWAVVSAVVAPVALVGGWLWAGALTPGYDPVRQTISDLASLDAPARVLMTTALVVTGIAHIVTAVALRPADVAGRMLLGVGGVATLLVAWIPNAGPGRNAVGHMIAAYLAFAALSAWPAVIAVDRPDAPFVLRRRFGPALALVLGFLVLLTIADIVTGGATLGLRERVLTTGQVLAPLVVVAGCVLAERFGNTDPVTPSPPV
jgi:hypothetical membrane protein